MVEGSVREGLAAARVEFSETGWISGEAECLVADCAKKQHIFDFIAVFQNNPGPSGFLRALSALFPDSERMWWAVALHALRPPHSDPTQWQPTLANYRFLESLLAEVESLDIPEEDFLALNHYPLACIVDDLLMSGIFIGCGMETVEQWGTPEFYDRLLNGDFPSPTAHGLSPIGRAEALIACILRILENHGVSRLRLGIGSATLHCGIPDVDLQAAREDLIVWLVKRGVGPYLLYMVRHGILLPQDGALVPNFKRISRLEKDAVTMNGVLGLFNSDLFVKAIRSIEACSCPGGYPTGNDCIDECVASYIRWHESLGLFGALEAALTQ